jgi:hypothetical protein
MSDIDTNETTIPALPCVSLEGTLPFYRALGFEVTYEQKAPYLYAVVKRGGIELHFYGLKGHKPEECHSTCLVLVPDIESLHQTYATALRAALGKLPVKGFPHITRMRPGQGRFTLVDPSGNSVIYIKRSAQDADGEQKSSTGKLSVATLAKAIETAAVLRDSKNDDPAAAKVLDVALAKYTRAPALDRARALTSRTELAIAMGHDADVERFRRELERIDLTTDEREQVRQELEALDELQRAIK